MLVGAGEIDAALLVVAADDGPRAQTLEHLELLDALGIARRARGRDEGRRRRTRRARPRSPAEVAALLARTSLAGAPVLAASATTGEGIDAVRGGRRASADRVAGPGWRAGRAAAPRDRPGVRGQGPRRPS